LAGWYQKDTTEAGQQKLERLIVFVSTTREEKKFGPIATARRTTVYW